jgi:hypothetical protein
MAVRRHQFGGFSLDPNERRGLLITVTGGRLFGGSLSLLAEGFPARACISICSDSSLVSRACWKARGSACAWSAR